MTTELTQYKLFGPRQDLAGRRVSFFAGPFATMLLWPFQNGLFSQSRCSHCPSALNHFETVQ